MALFTLTLFSCKVSAQSYSEGIKYLSGDTPAKILNYPENNPSLVKHQSFYHPDNSNAATRVTIIASQSNNNGWLMDTIWKIEAQSLGASANILPQTALNDTSFFASTDILIISSGETPLTDISYKVLVNYLMSGRSAYLQCEYMESFAPDTYFPKLVDTLGGSFNWISELTEDISPVTILGTLSTTPYKATTISYFWYGVSGGGDGTITNFLVTNGNYVGFIFNPPNTKYGELITTTDEDWINKSKNDTLMANILYSLKSTSHTVGVTSEVNVKFDFNLYQNYPNPFNPTTSIKYSLTSESNVKVTVFNILGEAVKELAAGVQNSGVHEINFDASKFSSGVYLYSIYATSLDGKQNFTCTKKMILLK